MAGSKDKEETKRRISNYSWVTFDDSSDRDRFLLLYFFEPTKKFPDAIARSTRSYRQQLPWLHGSPKRFSD